MSVLDRDQQLSHAIAALPRMPLAQLPTPLEEAPRLSERLGVHVLVKRDDQTGLALGGNKARKLEFLIAHALAQGADVVVTTGGSQSNHARMTAAACRKAALDCHLVLDRGVHPEPQGNLLLDELFGAKVDWVESEDRGVASAEMENVAQQLRAQGRTPHIIPRGGSVPQGTAGYALFVLELREQLKAHNLSISHLYLATGSTGTHSGILAGLIVTGAQLTLQGISVSKPENELVQTIVDLTSRTLDYLGFDRKVDRERVLVDDRYRGPGYGVPTSATMNAIELAARDEGLILDPAYTGKAMAGLIDHAGEGRFASSDTVVFLHTGGAPALFAYHRELLNALDKTPIGADRTHGA